MGKPNLIYRRGLLRIYIVIFICWIAACFAQHAMDTSTPWTNNTKLDLAPPKSTDFIKISRDQQVIKMAEADSDFKGLPKPEQYKVVAFISQRIRIYRRERLVRTIELALIPPLMVYIFFFVLIPWIIQGFVKP